jgi:hypothetical protein
MRPRNFGHEGNGFMPRLRTAKAVASRIDLNYFNRWHPLRGTRMVLSVLVGAGALLWWGIYGTRGKTALYNPGPVSHAHAMFEQSCTVCHDADGKGGFFKSVSDNACRQCHDGSVHAATQTQFISLAPGSGSGGGGGGGNAGSAHPGSERWSSTNCTHCHMEHRGEPALKGIADTHCTQCHADLPAHTKGGKPSIDPAVTAFAAGSHPNFGRELTESKQPGQKDAVLIDPTVLSFNHAKHMPMPAIANDCTKCHTTADPNPKAKPPTFTAEDSPPWSGEKDRPVKWDDMPQRAYMQPVSYEHHCQGCHRLELPPGTDGSPTVLPHQRMEVVRAAIAGLPIEKLQWLAPKPTPKAEGSTGGSGGGGVRRPPPRPRYIGPPDGPVRTILAPARPPPRPGATPPAASSETKDEGPVTANDVAIKNLEKQLRAVPSETDEQKKNKEQLVAQINQLKEVLKPPATAPATQPAEAPWQVDPSLVELYAVYMASSKCTLCHSVQGTVPRVASPPSQPPAAAAAGASPVLHTVPTGIPSSPRRWFAHSQFDHAPHRNMTCVSCHSKTTESTLTSDVLSPNLSWTDDQKHSASCTDCHHTPTASSRGARADCQACHLYHDRTQEGPPMAVASLADVVGWSNGKGTPRNAAQSAKPPPGAGTPAAAPDGSPPPQPAQ